MAGKRRPATGGTDKLEKGLSSVFGACRCTIYGSAMCCVLAVMWVALAVLWIGGSYIAKDAKLPGAISCASKSNVSIGFGGNSFIWWASTSGIIVIVTLIATCLYCCCFACVGSDFFSKIVTYVAIVGIILSLLCFSVLLAWMGLGTYMATLVVDTQGQTCINYFILLSLFFLYLATLIVFCVVSCIWKLHGMALKRREKSAA